METLLKQDFTTHYSLPISSINNISKQTNAKYFEIEDDPNRETQIYNSPNNGTAIYRNPDQKVVNVINYDKFITSLDANFQKGRKRCDLIVYTKNSLDYFLLNELKDANPNKGRKKAKSQLVASLIDLMSVSSIKHFADSFNEKRCCFFNKRIIAPQPITAVTAFGRVNNVSLSGLIMANSDIESYGFSLYEYSGGQIFTL
jgi:hypothetical protein